MLAENTLLKTAYHFRLLLVRFDTLTYRKDYDRSPILVGHHCSDALIFGMVIKDKDLLRYIGYYAKLMADDVMAGFHNSRK